MNNSSKEKLCCYSNVYKGKFYIDEKGAFNCPICGRNRHVLQNNGDIRIQIHCKCRTGNHHTVFRFDMGAYIYRYENGDCLLIV